MTENKEEQKQPWYQKLLSGKGLLTGVIIFVVALIIGISLGSIKCKNIPNPQDTVHIYNDTLIITDTLYKDTLKIPVPISSNVKPDTQYIHDTTYVLNGDFFKYNQEYLYGCSYSNEKNQLWWTTFKTQKDTITQEDSTVFNTYNDKNVGSFTMYPNLETGEMKYQSAPPIINKENIAKFQLLTSLDYGFPHKFGVTLSPQVTILNRLRFEIRGQVYSGFKSDSLSPRDWYSIGVGIGWLFF